jgi:hypothetical protein
MKSEGRIVETFGRRTGVRTLAFLAAASVTVAVQSLAATLYVSQTSANPSPPYSSRTTAAHAIQQAVDAAREGDAVLVAPGIYALTKQVSITRGILLRSDSGPGRTSLDGQWYTRCLWMANPRAVVDGFTMTRGHETDGNDLAVGVVMTGGTLTNCVVARVGSPFDGRLVYCSGGGLITDCQIGPNSGFEAQGAGVYLVRSELRNSAISRMLSGLAYGGADDGACVYAVSSTISGCTMSASYARRAGGGAFLDGCVMDRCIISGNRAGVYLLTPGRGGGVYATNSVIRNSLIAGNVSDNGHDPQTDTDARLPGFGGGIFLNNSSLLSCTVTGNRTLPPDGPEPSRGGGIYVVKNGGGGGQSTVTNSIIYFNSSPSGANWYWNDPLLPVSQLQLIVAASFTFSCTTPDPGGPGDITQDPQLVDATNGDFHPASTSPCVDAGITQPWMIGAQDLDGNPRISGASVDIGAYETSVKTTQELVVALIAQGNGLVLDGTLSHGHGNAMLASLRAALKSINGGNTETACGQVGGFIGKVQEYMADGELSQGDGLSLIRTANNLRTALGCGGQ